MPLNITLVPQMPPVSIASDAALVVPLLAVKVTLFMCWLRHTPHIGRWTVIKDPNGIESIFWSQVRGRKFEGSQPQNLPTDKVRATFVMTRADVQNLKKWVSTQLPTLSHVSTFTVTCAYIWSCMIKARAISREEVGEDELEHFVVRANCRALLVPPIPSTYLGNCLARCFATTKSTQLIGEDGFLIAAGVIGKAIRERVRNEEGVLKGAEKWISDYEALKRERVVGIAGSPKFAIYDIDFGWGKPKKNEVISIDITGLMSLNECRDAVGDLEVGLSFPRIKMEAFAAIFSNGLSKVPSLGTYASNN
ncbi:hypothetical protein L1049_003424 [Liquidambar formosana]|uniref:Uncharacterized protein n=1 Tax=Liquidambar formosana TaxID=63359 RepID=A0AAP0QYF8_LIQFO